MPIYKFPSVGVRDFAEATIDTNAVFGNGGSDFPVVVIPLSLSISYPLLESGLAVEIRQLSYQVALTSGGYITPIHIVPLNARVTDDQREYKGVPAYLQIPLGYDRIALLERKRKGGDLQLRLDCHLFADVLARVTMPHENRPTIIWGIVNHYELSMQAEMTNPRSVWLDRVLPGAGYGKVYLIELPAVPIDSCAPLQKAHAALLQAQQFHRQGLYDDAIGKCRVALEPFFESVEDISQTGEKRRISALKRSWQTKLGEATFKWLNASLIAVKEPTNKAHHSPGAYFDQVDAEMLLAVTTALVAYAVKTHPDGPPL